MECQWISVEDRLPDLNATVLLTDGNTIWFGGRKIVNGIDWRWCGIPGIIFLQKDGTLSADMIFDYAYNVTQWSPLIGPPQDTDQCPT